MKRILFVDDEPLVLHGLRRMLHRQRERWDMEFVASAEDALDRLAEQAYDAVVSDFRMPRVDGGELLETVRHRQPAVARVVLSGFADGDDLRRMREVAHCFLYKPCAAGDVVTAVEQALAMSGQAPG